MPDPSPEYPVRVDRRVFVPMDDGVRIALTVYLPDSDEDGPYPTVVESLPYRKDDAFCSVDWSTYAYLARDGFAGVRIDIRGTGASTGVIEDEYVAREQADTLAVFDWLEAQEWCSGNLGMWGVSWGGFSALQTAMLGPPQLKAIAPVHATHDRFACDVHYTGGSLHAQEQVDWPPSMVVCNALPPDPDIVGDTWFEEWMERLESTPQWPGTWLRHQLRDDYWLHGSPCADYGSIRCPTLLIGGWLDGYVDGMLALAQHLECPTRTVIGPWGHYRPATGVPGPTFDHLDLLSRWFGHHLRGDDNGVMGMSPVTLFIREGAPNDGESARGHWRAESEWPPADIVRVEHALSDTAHDRLTWDGPQWVGAHAPAWDRGGVGSSDGNEDDRHSLVFDLPILTVPLEILGTPEVEVTVTTDRRVGMVAARLLAVSPEGESKLIARGNRNLAFPFDLGAPSPVAPGRPVTVRFPLLATSATLDAGWHLRLALAGADFPVVWPPGERFALTVDPDRSRLILPTLPARAVNTRIEVRPGGDLPAQPGAIDRSTKERRTERNGIATTHTRSLRDMEHLPDRKDLTMRSDQTWSVSVDDDDPATTRARSEVESSLERPGWTVTTRGTLDLRADVDDFHLEISLTAWHNQDMVFSRTWVEDVPRTWA